MFRPTQKPIEFRTKFIEEHLKELQESLQDGDEHVFDEVIPKLNVPTRRQVAKDLPKIEVKPHPGPAVVKRKPYPFSQTPTDQISLTLNIRSLSLQNGWKLQLLRFPRSTGMTP
jgi:hypothetical protein